MRTPRFLMLVLLVLLIPIATFAPAAAASPGIVLAQDPGSDEGVDAEGSESEDTQGEGQKEAEAESGAGAGETEEGESTEEEGPPWTYQMARITLVLVLLLGAVIGVQYYRMIAARQKGAH